MISFDEHVRSNQFNLTANLAIGYDFIVCGAGSSGSVVARRPIAFPCTAATSGRVAGGLCGGLKAVAGSGAATKRWQPGNNFHFLDDARSVATANSGPFGSTSKLISKIRGGSGATGQSGLLSTHSNAISGINDIVTATAGLANNLGSLATASSAPASPAAAAPATASAVSTIWAALRQRRQQR
jgi:hypothetical protein